MEEKGFIGKEHKALCRCRTCDCEIYSGEYYYMVDEFSGEFCECCVGRYIAEED